MFEHHLRDGQSQLWIAVATAVGDIECELGGPVEVAKPASAGSPQDEVRHATPLGSDRGPGRVVLQVGKQFG